MKCQPDPRRRRADSSLNFTFFIELLRSQVVRVLHSLA